MDFSHPPLHDDASDDSSYDFYDSDIYDDYGDDLHSHHYSSILANLDDKSIQAVGDIVGDPVDSRKTKSEFHSALSTCELNITER